MLILYVQTKLLLSNSDTTVILQISVVNSIHHGIYFVQFGSNAEL